MLYKIVFQASGYEYNTWDDPKIAGFYVAVLVHAFSNESAVNLAYEMLVNSDGYIQKFPLHEHPNALIEVDSISLMEEDLSQSEQVSGFIFYPPDEQIEDNEAKKH